MYKVEEIYTNPSVSVNCRNCGMWEEVYDMEHLISDQFNWICLACREDFLVGAKAKCLECDDIFDIPKKELAKLMADGLKPVCQECNEDAWDGANNAIEISIDMETK